MLWQAVRQWLIVVSLLQLYNALGKDLLLPRCVKIASINTPLDDPTRAAENYGVKANSKRAFLSNTPGIFKIHKGLVKENGTVSFEALNRRRYFLRHKNYHFHLEKKFNNSMFRKDATFFILKVTEHPPLYAFELYSHPAWFMRHLKHKPHRLVLRRVNEASSEVMDSTFFLAPSRCHTHTKHGPANPFKKTVLVGDGTFIDTADEEEADIASARANDLHVEAFEKDFERKETDSDKAIKIHTEDDENDDKTPILIHTESDVESAHPAKPARTGDAGKGGPEESSNQILNEIEQAFRMAQRGNNTSYLEKIEKDIENKVNQIAASASDKKGKESDSSEVLDADKGRNIDDIEIHTEADEEPAKPIDEHYHKTEIHTEADPPKRKKEKSSIDRIKKMLKGNKQTRVEVLGPVMETGQVQKTETYDETKPSEIDKDIVVTGNPKMTGKVTIESKYASKGPNKAVKKEDFHQEKLTGFNIDDVRNAQKNVTHDLLGMKMPQAPHTKHAHMAYRDYSEAHKVLSTNIENLRKVLKAIEDVPSSNLNEHGIEMVKQPRAGYYSKVLSFPSNATAGSKQQFNASDSPLSEDGASSGNKIPPYLPQHPFYYRPLQSQSSTQTTLTPLPPAAVSNPRPRPAALANHPKAKVETSIVPLWNTVAPGLHVVQSNGNFLMTNATSQVSSDIPDRFNAALVDNDSGNDAAVHHTSHEVHASAGQVRDNSLGSSAGQLISRLNAQNRSLQETFKELTPEDTAKIFYLGECKDEFPKACEDWAGKRYCLTFSELMKRYCKKACKLCNHVLATGFTPCDRSCGGGVRLRMIKVNSRQVLQRRSCNVNSCPVNGGYTSYSDWSECSVTCGEGVRYRHRSCTSPKPQFGGYDCSHLGPPVDTIPCYKSCKGFKFQTEQHHSEPVGLKTHKHHSLVHADPGAFPEYTAEQSNPKATEPVGESDPELNNEEIVDSGSGNQLSGYETEFKWPSKHQRKKPLVLHHVHKNIYRHRDHKGNHHLLNIEEEKHPYDESQSYEDHSLDDHSLDDHSLDDHSLDDHSLDDQIHTHVVRYKGQQVARMECGPSHLLQYHKHVANNPSGYKRSPSYKMFDAGEIMYDKYGLPTDTTKNIVQAFDSPYKIILQRNKNNQMKILEQCIESDASVNPDADLRAGQFTNYGSNPLEGEQRSLTASSRVPPDKAMSNRYAANGLYEYKYEDIGQGYGDNDKQLLVDKDLKDQLMKAYKTEAAELNERSLRSGEAKPTLTEQLAIEREEALREKAYEDMMAKKSKMAKNNFAQQ